jgi:hypothetical protein
MHSKAIVRDIELQRVGAEMEAMTAAEIFKGTPMGSVGIFDKRFDLGKPAPALAGILVHPTPAGCCGSASAIGHQLHFDPV